MDKVSISRSFFSKIKAKVLHFFVSARHNPISVHRGRELNESHHYIALDFLGFQMLMALNGINRRTASII